MAVYYGERLPWWSEYGDEHISTAKAPFSMKPGQNMQRVTGVRGSQTDAR